MSTAPRIVKNADIEKMLSDCAPGTTVREGRRRRVATCNGKSHHYPKGDRTLEVGHLVKWVSQLEINTDCASLHFPTVTFRR